MENIFDSVGQGSFLHHPVHMSYVDGRYLLFGLSQLQFLQLLFHVFFFVSDVQPCPFCVYKFFDFPDHDTTIVTSSNTPYFDDCKTFPVAMTAELDKYLRAQVSCWFVLCPPVNLKFAF